MKELVILSGKGGTGKTTITSAFASLAKHAVLADCDVDAADLHLILKPTVVEKQPFYSGHEALIETQNCDNCGRCVEVCRFAAIRLEPQSNHYQVDAISCEGCGVCVTHCPQQAIQFNPSLCGEWYCSDTRFGSMVHARLGIGAENSGRLVSLVRQQARQLASQQRAKFLLVDGPPGIGCPAIAAMTGADQLFLITEPTLSGLHDLQRVLELAKHFRLPAFLCVNKWDLNLQLTEQLEALAQQYGAKCVGRLSYHKAASLAQLTAQSVIELGDNPLADEIQEVWQRVEQHLYPYASELQIPTHTIT